MVVSTSRFMFAATSRLLDLANESNSLTLSSSRVLKSLSWQVMPSLGTFFFLVVYGLGGLLGLALADDGFFSLVAWLCIVAWPLGDDRRRLWIGLLIL